MHIDQPRQRHQVVTTPPHAPFPQEDWALPSLEHDFVNGSHELPTPHYPAHDRRPPDCYWP